MKKAPFHEDEKEIVYFGDGENRMCKRYCSKCGSFVCTLVKDTDFSMCMWCGSKYDLEVIENAKNVFL